MRVVTKEVTVQSRKRREVINVTSHVEEFVRESGIKNGMVLVFLPHATSALFANEDEPRVRRDYENLFERLVPADGNYFHNEIDNNADAHLLTTIFKQFYVLPIVNGELIRGTWQEVFLAEFDGPRNRRMVLVAIGE
ncbi:MULTISPECIES: secondary thiamine-phosphate synthase enzyme YjbQ [Vulcanisaeta]|uniref:secondary thiamine-phosphate synthase enzyme YjbQ n=1 Tax=Vulcanisaeta TaxID=164450 RepID=UPI0006D0605B|nr:MULTISPECIES: secondary thiamine-phosphate synthase enzyme YjbQ [Vulcanisaeta]